MDREAKIAEAKRLRSEGLSYAKIGKIVGVSKETARLWCNPNVADSYRQQQRELSPEHRERKRKREREWHRRRGYHWESTSTLAGRCKKAISASTSESRRRGFAPCNATVEQLMEAFDGHCQCCGRQESEFQRRLSMDHCHQTGNFRGWLCHGCNMCAGQMQDDVIPLLNYLRPDLAGRLLETLGQGAT
ncbi:MAG: hypothetical protein C0485_07620 [Pirellula sp.]|nr:hypothetical protein [Pirellula sp.]